MLRQDRVRDRIFAACSTAKLAPVCEQKNWVRNNKLRPGDIFLPSWSEGQTAVLDVTITAPLQLNLNSDAVRCVFALTNAEERKYEQYAQYVAKYVSSLYQSCLNLSEILLFGFKMLKRIALERNVYILGHFLFFLLKQVGTCARLKISRQLFRVH